MSSRLRKKKQRRLRRREVGGGMNVGKITPIALECITAPRNTNGNLRATLSRFEAACRTRRDPARLPAAGDWGGELVRGYRATMLAHRRHEKRCRFICGRSHGLRRAVCAIFD